jgi:hypothetical protein
MKKLIILSALFGVIATSAFAQLNVGAYTSSFWVPYRVTVPEEGDPIHSTAVQTPWGEPDISAGINVDGWSEWGGIHLGVEVANGAKNQVAGPFSAKGNGWVWVKPLDFVPFMDTFTIYAGSPNSDTLTGKIGGSNLATYVLNNSYALRSSASYRLEIQEPQYNIFTRLNPYSWGKADNGTQNLYWPQIGAAVMLTVEPIEHLFIGAFIAPEQFDIINWGDIGGASWADTESANGDKLASDDINQDYYEVKKVYKRMQIQAGYDIPGIGLARVQWIGVRNTIEAAFQIRALGDVVIDIGFKLPYEGTNAEDTSTYKKRKDFQAAVAATYRNYDFRLLGRVDAAFAGSDSSGREISTRGLNLIAYLIPSYQLKVGMVGLDFGFEYEQKDDFNGWKKDSMQSGAGLWFSRSMGNANFKVAAVTRFPFEWEENKQPFDLFFPIYLQVGF